jgi:4-diphosphocytidyl-2-C-methyl-D-erythritol kinase
VVLVNPGVALATQDVFASWARTDANGQHRADKTPVPRDRAALLEFLQSRPNELEPAAIRVESSVARVLAAVQASPGCLLARMSGSGATCFGLFASSRTAATAARKLASARPTWWVRPTVLG